MTTSTEGRNATAIVPREFHEEKVNATSTFSFIKTVLNSILFNDVTHCTMWHAISPLSHVSRSVYRLRPSVGLTGYHRPRPAHRYLVRPHRARMAYHRHPYL